MHPADFPTIRPWRPPVTPTLYSTRMTCERCGEETPRNSASQLYCPACSETRKRETVARNNAKRTRTYERVTPREAPTPFREARFAELDRAISAEPRYRLPGRRDVYRWLRECGYKRCPTCETVKDMSLFHKCAASPDGRASECAACNKTHAADWRAAYPEKQRAIRARSNAKKRERRAAGEVIA